MQVKMRLLWMVLFALAVVLSACGISPSTPAATTDPNAVLTAAAQTAYARGTELALATPSPELATPTSTAILTVQPATPTITVTLPTTGTATALPTQPPGFTPGPAAGDRADFIDDITIPDGTNLAPGAQFTKTWRLKNSGTTTWSTAYSLVHVSNDEIAGPASVALPESVAPGEIVDLSVDLVAPEASGTHISYWKLSNDRGQLFGIGPAANEAFYVQINVGGDGGTSTPGPTSTPGSGALISNLSVSIEEEFVGACPHEFTVTAIFTLSRPATITYQLEADSDKPGFTFNLPPAQTSVFAAGTHTLVFTLNVDSSVDGWVRLRITEPEEARSKKAEFSLTCR